MKYTILLILLLVLLISGCDDTEYTTIEYEEEIDVEEEEVVETPKTCSELNGFECIEGSYCAGDFLQGVCCAEECVDIEPLTTEFHLKETKDECYVPYSWCEDGSCKILLVVEDSLLEPLANELETWKNDVSYDVDIIGISEDEDPKVLKNTILEYYANNNLQGVMFVGRIPTAFVTFGTEFPFPSDAYYLDITGECYNNFIDKEVQDYEYIDGYYNLTSPNCNKFGFNWVHPFWMGRLTVPGSLDEVSTLKDYFNRNHDYRTGNLKYNQQMLTYYPIITESGTKEIEDTSNEANFHVSRLYNDEDITFINLENYGINSDVTYLAELNKPFELVYYNGHGVPWGHEDTIDFDEVLAAEANSLFYEMASCSVGRFTWSDYLAGAYLFSGNGLVVNAASTPIRTANAFLSRNPHDFMSIGMNFGDVNLLTGTFNVMHILGDPTLSLRDGVSNSGKVCVDSNKLNFGTVSVGETKEVSVEVKNIGSTSFEIIEGLRQVVNPSPYSVVISPWSCKGIVEPGESIDCVFTFRPPMEGIYRGRIVLVTTNGLFDIPFEGSS